ncbi:MgtE intracellular N domain-containing protein [Acetitomaculum ruminis DSM 5522]|uniref:MgtE intracellular N domain-containing protein n=1 Tax=Acetitomaculum ruminis DSM 5522 TaxID=1120918 RepID=A0A1I0ZHC7_9FIRM|nr:hypothetical protein [Acetitomaculum ruminis]SFB25055.1 MgtE intracellular N domain-containing protein [Acetitomaculum ruminis DSM 5522]
MADEKDNSVENAVEKPAEKPVDKAAEKRAKKEAKREAKEAKKREKLEKEAAKRGMTVEELLEERSGGKLSVVILTFLILLVWLAIFAALIKFDVGGFGSTVLYPMLKDVPYVNKILPDVEDDTNNATGEESKYQTLDEALARIDELEKELSAAKSSSSGDSDKISELEEEVSRLKVYEENQTAFQTEKENFYREVVFGDNAPDINEYKTYYESIDSENAAKLYKEVLASQEASQEVQDYASTYASMKPKQAAAILETMTDNLSLVAKILDNMDTEDRANILGNMDKNVAAQLTKLMNPD